MKYITMTENGFDHDAYWTYLDEVGMMMPPHILQFAADPANHNLSSPNSLHDSWLESLAIKEQKSSEPFKRRNMSITIVFLGSRHDRYIYLSYNHVLSYNFDYPPCPADLAVNNNYHGDLLVHELVQLEGDRFRHEFIFSSQAKFIIDFSEFNHRVEIISK